MTEGYFSIKRDNELIAAGTHFWCQACVVARPLVEQSPDPRYCLSCYEVLKTEAGLLAGRKKPTWVPRVADSNTNTSTKPPEGQRGVTKVIPPNYPQGADKNGIMLQKKKGRPVKEGAVTRMTRWRRAKQGALL